MMHSHRDTLIICFIIICSIWSIEVHGQNNNFIISDFGGISDGRTDNRQALANAWKKACATSGGMISIPKGTFLASIGDFVGPCTGATRFIVDGTLKASGSSSVDESWLTFKNIDGLTISGAGTVDGNGASAWSGCKAKGNCGNRPSSLKLGDVKNVLIQGISFVNSKMFHLHINDCQNVNVKNVRISAPDESPNTDGIHVSRSDHVSIKNSFIGTGDDCVSIGDGSRNIDISGVLCGPGHGISIGSLGKYNNEADVSGITVRNCTLSKTTNGLRIKTWAPSKSSIVVSNVTFANIKLNSVTNPIIIDQHYCPHGSCQKNGESSVEIKGVKYVNVRGSSSEAKAVDIQCSKSKPCLGINLLGVKIIHNGQPTTAICSNGGIKFGGRNQIPKRCQ